MRFIVGALRHTDKQAHEAHALGDQNNMFSFTSVLVLNCEIKKQQLTGSEQDIYFSVLFIIVPLGFKL